MTRCSQCQAEAQDGARFCHSCGGSLTEIGEATPALGETRPWASAEAAEVCSAIGDDRIAQPGAVLAGRYRVLGKLGEGASGSVFRAQDQVLSQDVALKFVSERMACDPTAISILRNEVKTARRVSHPNVCGVYDIGEIEGRTFISMEYSSTAKTCRRCSAASAASPGTRRRRSHASSAPVCTRHTSVVCCTAT